MSTKTEKYYVSGCVEIAGTCSQVADDAADFFTLYQRDAEGLSNAIVDLGTRKDAEEVMAVYRERDRLLEREKALAVNDYFGSLVSKAVQAAEKAMVKFPQPNYALLKFAEEAGEVVQAGVHYAEGRETWESLEGEVVQTIAMLYRLVNEGDHVNGVFPPSQLRAKPAKDRV